MLRIIQTSVQSAESKDRIERDNHQNAYEYIPMASGKTYYELSGEKKCAYLIVTLPKLEYESNTEDNTLVNGQQMRKILSAVIATIEEIGDIELISASYNEQMEENVHKEALITHYLLYRNGNLLSEKEINMCVDRLTERLRLENKNYEKKPETPIFQLPQAGPVTSKKKEEKVPQTFKKPERVKKTEKERRPGERKQGEAVPKFEKPIYQEKREEMPRFDSFYNTEDLMQNEAEGFHSSVMEVGKETPLSNEIMAELDKRINENIPDEPAYIPDEAEEMPETQKIKVEIPTIKTSSEEVLPYLNRITEYYATIPLENTEQFYEIKDRFEEIKTTSSKEKLRSSFQQTIKYFTTTRATKFFSAQTGDISQEQFMSEVEAYIERVHNIPLEDKKVFMEEVYNAVFSYYKLTAAINDESISDIKVLAPDNINVKIKGQHYTLEGTRFINENDYLVFIKALLTRNKVRVTSPIILFTDIDFHPEYTLRFNLTMPEINTSRFPVLHIRKTEKHKLSVDDLIKAEMMPQKVADYLKEKTKTSSIVFAGPPASGKTKALNAYVEEIPWGEAALCIQESDEIFAEYHPNLMCQHILKDARGNIIYGLDEIGTNGLVCDINWFIIGEIKGAEARTFLRACNTGNHVLCTIHSPNAKETIPRFADYIKYGSDYSLQEAERMLKDLEVIVYIEGFKVREIVEIKGYDDTKKCLIYETVYLYDKEPEVV